MLSFIRRPVRSIAFLSRLPVRRLSANSDAAPLELVLKNLSSLRSDICSLHDDISDHKKDYGVFISKSGSTREIIGDLRSELDKFTDEFVNLQSDIRNYMVDYTSLRQNIETQMAVFEKNTDTRLDEIESKIKKTNAIYSVMNEQPQ
jgi:predicted  nucleic acid-binding Zn-ribbon protein